MCSGGELLRAVVPVVSAAGADLGGRDPGGAQQVPRRRWPHPIRQGRACPCPKFQLPACRGVNGQLHSHSGPNESKHRNRLVEF